MAGPPVPRWWRIRRGGPACALWLAPATIVAVSGFAWSCLVSSDPPPLEDGDLENLTVEPPRDAVFRPDEDQQERRAPQVALGGRLPGAFPKDFPLPDGSTVFDFGEVPQQDEVPQEGEASDPAAVEFVSVRLPLGAPAARDWLLREAQISGWRASSGEVTTFRQGERWVRIAIEPARTAGSSAVRFEYPGSPW